MENFAVSPHFILAHALAGDAQRAVVVTDIHGLVLLFNPAASLLLGYTAREVVRRVNAALFFDPEELKAQARDLTAQLKREVSPGFEAISARSHLHQTGERRWQYRHKDGSLVPVKAEILTSRDECGKLIGFSLVAEPIATEEAESHVAGNTISPTELASLRKSEAYYRAVVSGIQEGVVLQDAQGVVRTCNPSAERLLGLTLEQMNDPYLPGAPWDVVDEDGAPLPPSHYPLSTTLQTGQQCSRAVMGVRKPEGELTWLLFNTRPLALGEGETAPAVLMSFADISERKRFEAELAHTRDAALESARLKSAFLANVSHEIRTPLNGIVGIIDLLAHTPLNSEQQNFLHSLDVSAESLLTLIDDLLDLSKLEAGKASLEASEFEVATLFEDVIELLAPRVHTKDVELLLWLDDNVPPRLCGDAGRLRQIVINLLSNALKFTEEGEVIVRVKLHNETALGVTLAVEVRDTGIGLSPEAQTRVFDPFWQNEAPSGKRGGTGLGLAISRQLVEIMGGRIWVESSLAYGSTFSFTLRLQKGTAPREELASAATSFENRRLLVVDDNTTSRALLGHLLSLWNFSSALLVSNGKEALAALHAAIAEGAPFDGVILDQLMPDMNGAEFACALRSDAMLCATPLLMMTTLHGGEGECDGADLCLSKPLRASRLHQSLQDLFPPPEISQILPSMPHSSSSATISEQENDSLDAIPHPTDLRILVVEDNAINQQVAASQLKLLGCAFDIAHDGREALEIWERDRQQILLLDCQLPILDGYAVTEELRRREAAHGQNGVSPAYIIAMTAHAMPEDRLRCLSCGMDDYLSKPVRTATLKAALERWQQTQGIVPSVAPARRDTAATRGSDAPSPSATTLSSVLDFTMIEGLRLSASQGDLLGEMVALFLADAPIRLKAVQDACDMGDLKLAARHAHALSGSCSYFGASRLMAQCARLEEAATQGDCSVAHAAASEIENELLRVQDALSEFRSPVNVT